ncbi:MAG: sialate O-acetylesterase [Planctomycetota bacterium]
MSDPVHFVLRTSLALIALALLVTAQERKVVKVFVLAGQSNMEGKAQNELLESQAKDQKTAELFAHLRKDGHWIVRDDVFVKFLERKGGLTIGYGSPDRTGVELEFGWVLGDHFEEPVLLIKTAWGGHSLFRNFRPPSAGLPSDEKLADELERAQKRVTEQNEKNKRQDPLPKMEEIEAAYGKSYRDMIAEVHDVLAHMGSLFPELKGREPLLSGLVWHQGWNDQYEGAETEYASNMRHLIDDFRKEFDTPKLPVVVAVMGQNGSKPAKGAMKVIQDAQLAMNEVPFVRAVRTDELVDRAAEELYPTWKEHQEQWKLVGSDHGYHYLGSAIWHLRMGHAFGEAMLALIDPK